MLRSTLSSLREYITPVSHVSTFRESGEITPEEFVQAGDYLVYKFPTWSWASAPPSKRRSFLPPEKQYLVTKHVPSHYRASAFESSDTKFDAVDENPDDPDGWTATSFGDNFKANTSSNATTSQNNDTNKPSAAPEDLIVDIEDDDEDEDENAFIPSKEASSENETGPSSNSSSTRSYNLFITYSTSYRVPKLYLSGYSGDGTPLNPEQMFQDIMADYRNKTATIEKAPFEDDLTAVSIHPCRHASVMKSLLARAEARRVSKLEEQSKQKEKGQKEEDDWEEIEESDSQGALRVDQYLVVFLKFISSVTPGIEHDNTMSVL